MDAHASMIEWAPVRRIDFYKLSREKQERFLASTKGNAPPAPIVQAAGDGGRSIRWAALSVAALIAFIVVYALKFGALGAPLAVHGAHFIAIYAALAFVIPYGALRAVGSWRAGKLLPFKPGVYVFPMCLLDAREKMLRIFAMTDLAVSCICLRENSSPSPHLPNRSFLSQPATAAGSILRVGLSLKCRLGL